MNSPPRINSPERVHSPKKEVTRYGPIQSPTVRFGGEQRFQWQNMKVASDAVYNLPTVAVNRSITFGQSLRAGMDDENPDAKTRATGPGSYDVANSYDFLSEFVGRKATRFPCAARQSLSMKTPSPGAVYNIEKKYSNGPDTTAKISFPHAPRQSMYGSTLSSEADLYIPKPNYGPSITIAPRYKARTLGMNTPGAIYDVHKKVDFKTGPAFSFGKGKADRFKEYGFLPDTET